MSGNRSTERVIWAAWTLMGWAALSLLAGLATLALLHQVSPMIPPGPCHDLFGTLFVVVAWPLVTLVFRCCVKHGLAELPWWY